MSDVRILKFEAEWCGPCSTQSEILEDFDAAPVESIDVDENQDMAEEYGVMGIPTLVIERDGEEEGRFTGLTQLGELEDAVNESVK